MRKALAFLLLMSITTATIAEPDVTETKCIRPIGQTVAGSCLAGVGTFLLLIGIVTKDGQDNRNGDVDEFFLIGGAAVSVTGGIWLSATFLKWHKYNKCIDNEKQVYHYAPDVTVSIDF